MQRVVGMLAAAFALGPTAAAAAPQSGPITIDFDVATANRDLRTARTAGTFAMIGRPGTMLGAEREPVAHASA